MPGLNTTPAEIAQRIQQALGIQPQMGMGGAVGAGADSDEEIYQRYLREGNSPAEARRLANEEIQRRVDTQLGPSPSEFPPGSTTPAPASGAADTNRRQGGATPTAPVTYSGPESSRAALEAETKRKWLAFERLTPQEQGILGSLPTMVRTVPNSGGRQETNNGNQLSPPPAGVNADRYDTRIDPRNGSITYIPKDPNEPGGVRSGGTVPNFVPPTEPRTERLDSYGPVQQRNGRWVTLNSADGTEKDLGPVEPDKPKPVISNGFIITVDPSLPGGYSAVKIETGEPKTLAEAGFSTLGSKLIRLGADGKPEVVMDLKEPKEPEPPKTVAVGNDLKAWLMGDDGKWTLSTVASLPQKLDWIDRKNFRIGYDPTTGEMKARIEIPKDEEDRKPPITLQGMLYDGDYYAKTGELKLIPGQPAPKPPSPTRLPGGGWDIPAGPDYHGNPSARSILSINRDSPSVQPYQLQDGNGNVLAGGSPGQVAQRMFASDHRGTILEDNQASQYPYLQQLYQGMQSGYQPQQEYPDDQQGWGYDDNAYGGWGGQDVGWGGDTPPTQEAPWYDKKAPSPSYAVGSGADWSPPLNPSDVVGTGHKFGEPVDMEGIHKGLDLQAYLGKPVLSPVDGNVSDVEYNPEGLGLQVSVQGADGNQTKMSHLNSSAVQPGQPVGQGEEIAQVGSSGSGSTGPHLDVRIIQPNGAYANPEPLLGSLATMPRADKPAGQDVGAGTDYYDTSDNYLYSENDGFDGWQYEGDPNSATLWSTPSGGSGTNGGAYDPNDTSTWTTDDWIAANNAQANNWNTNNPNAGYDPSDYDAWVANYYASMNMNPDGSPMLDPVTGNALPQGPGANQNGAVGPTGPGNQNQNNNQNGNGARPNNGSGTGMPNPFLPQNGGPGVYPGGGSGSSNRSPYYSSPYSESGGSSGSSSADNMAAIQQRMQEAAMSYDVSMQKLAFDRQVHGDSLATQQQQIALDTEWHTLQIEYQNRALDINSGLQRENILQDFTIHQDNNALQRELASLSNQTEIARLSLATQQADWQHEDQLADLDFRRMAQGDSIALQREQMDVTTRYNENRIMIDSRQLELQESQVGFNQDMALNELNQRAEFHNDDNAFRGADLAIRQQAAAMQNQIDNARLGVEQQRVALDAMIAANQVATSQGQLALGQAGLAETGAWHQASIALDYARQQSEDSWRQVQAQIAQGTLALNERQTSADIAYKTAQTALAQGTLELNTRGQGIQQEQFGQTLQVQRDALQAQLDNNAKQFQLGQDKLQQDFAFHGDDERFRRDSMALTQQFHTEDSALKLQLANLDRQTQIDVSGTFEQKRQAAKEDSALRNPWLQRLTGRAPAIGTPGGPTGAANPAAAPQTAGAPTPPTPPTPAASPPVGAAAPQSLGAQMGGTGWNAPGTPTPTQGVISWGDFQKQSPFEKAADRTASEMSGIPWEKVIDDRRSAWAAAGGPTTAPNQTQMTTAGQSPLDRVGTEMTAESFGQSPEDYWTGQEKTWTKAQASQVQQQAA